MSDEINVDYQQVHVYGKKLNFFQRLVERNSIDLVLAQGQVLLMNIRKNIGRRPGPRNVSGDYQRSWQIAHDDESVTVYSDAPQSYRLEKGFVGADALGRHYDQPPFPHVRPAVEETKRQMGQASRKQIKQWAKESGLGG